MLNSPIHLRKYSFFKDVKQTGDSVTIPVWLTQDSLDGLNALIHYCEGARSSGGGAVPGEHELIMFYRTIKQSLHNAQCAYEDKINMAKKKKD